MEIQTKGNKWNDIVEFTQEETSMCGQHYFQIKATFDSKMAMLLKRVVFSTQ